MKVLFVICLLSFVALEVQGLWDPDPDSEYVEPIVACPNRIKCHNYKKFNETSCECECRDGCNPCHPPQVWNSNHCYCHCKERLKCNPKYQYWDEQSCSCKCLENRRGCCDGKAWNETSCLCQCVTKLECPPEMEFSFSDCRCVCKTYKNCTAPYVWLDDSCTCGCPPTRCPGNFIKNSKTCECDCNQDNKRNCTSSVVQWNSKKCCCECIKPKIECLNGAVPDPRNNCTSCIYRQKVGCPGNQRWNRQNGKCMCLNNQTNCAVIGDQGKHVWDDIKCECKCNIPDDQIACSPDEYFDYASCSCLCNVQERDCLNSLVWNPMTCRCELKSKLPAFDKLVQYVNQTMEEFPLLRDSIDFNPDP